MFQTKFSSMRWLVVLPWNPHCPIYLGQNFVPVQMLYDSGLISNPISEFYAHFENTSQIALAGYMVKEGGCLMMILVEIWIFSFTKPTVWCGGSLWRSTWLSITMFSALRPSEWQWVNAQIMNREQCQTLALCRFRPDASIWTRNAHRISWNSVADMVFHGIQQLFTRFVGKDAIYEWKYSQLQLVM